METRRKIDVNPFNSIGAIMVLVFIFVGLYFVAKGIFSILTLLAPVLLVGALLLDYTVVIDFGKWIIRKLKEQPLLGIAAILLCVFGFPIIAGFLCGKAYLKRKLKKFKAEYEDQSKPSYTKYEEVAKTEDTFQDFEDLSEPRLELPEIPKKAKDNGKVSDYDRIFEED